MQVFLVHGPQFEKQTSQGPGKGKGKEGKVLSKDNRIGDVQSLNTSEVRNADRRQCCWKLC